MELHAVVEGGEMRSEDVPSWLQGGRSTEPFKLFIQFATHMTFNFSMEIFRTHPDSKVIHTVLLLIFSVVIVIRERKFFFDKSFDEESLS